MANDNEIVFTPAGDRSDMIEVFAKQLDDTRAVFDEQNSTDFISLKSAAKANHMRNDYAGNLEMLVKHDFFVLTPDKEAVAVILQGYQELILEHSKLEVRPKKIKVAEEGESDEVTSTY